MGETESQSVGSIQIRERLHASSVYRGEQPGLGRSVAVRKLRRDLLGNTALVAEIEREARLGARLGHPNVVAVYDFFSQRGDLYLVMEYVDGPSLRTALAQGPLPEGIAALVSERIARGIAALHARGIVHTDLRPENVLLGRWGQVKLRGLGSARELGERGRLTGAATPYRPTEDDDPGPACDIWSLGIVIGEMLCGKPRAGGGGRLGRLARRCAHPKPERRPPIGTVLAELARIARRRARTRPDAELAAWLWEITSAREEGRPASRSPGARSNLPRLALLGSAGLAGALLIAAWTLSREPARELAPALDAASAPERELFADLEPVAQGPDARVRVAAYPWAEVRIDGGEPFLTPRARPFELRPGSHEIAFKHPRLGEVKREYRFEPGEESVVRHVFDAAGGP